jgi:DNA-directed RNA polymerase sigma subunit (sigma70/sigma32)
MVSLNDIPDLPDAQQNPLGSLLDHEIQDLCLKVLYTLTPREARVTTMRFAASSNLLTWSEQSNRLPYSLRTRNISSLYNIVTQAVYSAAA